MFSAIGQYVGAKVLTAILVVSGAGAVIWFWKHPEALETIWVTVKYVLVWIGIVLMVPWVSFFVTTWVVSKESNVGAALLLVGLSLVDAIVAIVLIGGLSGHNALTWMVLVLGFLSAAAYNFKVCEYQAERLEMR